MNMRNINQKQSTILQILLDKLTIELRQSLSIGCISQSQIFPIDRQPIWSAIDAIVLSIVCESSCLCFFEYCHREVRLFGDSNL